MFYLNHLLISPSHVTLSNLLQLLLLAALGNSDIFISPLLTLFTFSAASCFGQEEVYEIHGLTTEFGAVQEPHPGCLGPENNISITNLILSYGTFSVM